MNYLFRIKPTIGAAPSLDEITSLIQFAEDESLTVHDAIYIRLALESNASLATIDADMRRCAQRLNIPLVPT